MLALISNAAGGVGRHGLLDGNAVSDECERVAKLSTPLF
jgi:hypothetical protein